MVNPAHPIKTAPWRFNRFTKQNKRARRMGLEEEGTPTGFTPSKPSPENPMSAATVSVESIRDYVDHRLHEADLRYQQRYEFSQKALERAHDELGVRLDAMNEFRAALADSAARTPTRDEVEGLGNMLRTERRAEITPIRDRIDAMSRTNWPLLAGAIGVAFSLVSALWVIVSLKIDATNAPLATSVQTGNFDRGQLNDRLRVVEVSTGMSTAADSASKADRIQLTDRLATVEQKQNNNLANTATAQTRNESSLIEIETQFKGLSNGFNVNQDHNQQIQSLLWSQVFSGTVLPPTPFRPQLYK